ncbi:Ceroid-lipofuscinosis neuronal protein 5 [Carpediemonas membranifera]|uniref:Ceroid-lipofuscinosis neuronal protein 5 n=1 Tax=Carpediemonas membranifera TaxID=201153 RepID=A0A8J6AXF6_9EUKA|nr:Ceroid-lipofuscinosis neuronal protein 5 [Carpediemonas membranifera]|eukprot:KAG9393915.1 Ceroid-lipofuscinosis neuronal protein 5 [Carpediemonas membranifera]
MVGKGVTLVLLCFIYGALAIIHDVPWVDVEPTSRWASFYMLDPLLDKQVGDITKAIGAYHAGMGFVEIGGSRSFTFELLANNLTHAVFPTVNTSLPAEEAVQWNDKLEIHIENGINHTLWDNVTYVAEISGTQFNQVHTYSANYNTTMSYYRLLGAIDTAPDPSTTWFEANTCQDYAEDVLKEMDRLHVTWDYKTRPTRDYVYYITKKPFEVSMDSPVWAERIEKFYELFQIDQYKSLDAFIAAFTKYKGMYGFVVQYEDHDKYWALPWRSPFITYTVEEIEWLPPVKKDV